MIKQAEAELPQKVTGFDRKLATLPESDKKKKEVIITVESCEETEIPITSPPKKKKKSKYAIESPELVDLSTAYENIMKSFWMQKL